MGVIDENNTNNNDIKIDHERLIRDMLTAEIIITVNSDEFAKKVHEAAVKVTERLLGKIVSEISPTISLTNGTIPNFSTIDSNIMYLSDINKGNISVSNYADSNP